jgi:ABC-2 type transport system permease protein
MAERRFEWLPVVRWELARVLRRGDFIASVLLTPLLAVGFGWLPSLLLATGKPVAVALVRVEASGALAPQRLANTRLVRWTAAPAEVRDLAGLERAVREKRVAGAVALAADFPDSGRATVVMRASRPAWLGDVRAALREEARRELGARIGLDAAALARLETPLQLRERVAAADGGSRDPGAARAERIVGLVIVCLMMIVLFSTISYLMIGISGEKQARVTEVVVSAIRAESWMDGKILAFTLIGLLMALVWTASLFILGGALAFSLPLSVRAGSLLVDVAFAVLGLYFYNALFAAVLATMQGIESSAKFQGYFFMLPMAPMLFIGPLLRDPEAGWLVAVSQLPPLSPTLLPVRIALGAAQPWEIALGLALLALGGWWMRGVAGRIFRVGMLMYGKDPTLPEILRWMRAR